MRKTVYAIKICYRKRKCFSFWGRLRPPDPLPGLPPPGSRWEIRPRGIVPLRHLRHVPPDSIATVVNSLQNRVNSITLCITLNAKTGKIVLVTLCIQIEWLFCNVRLV